MSTTKQIAVGDLIDLLYSYERERFEGTLQVAVPGGDGCYLRLDGGQVTDLLLTTTPTILERALFDYPGLKDRDKKRIRKQATTEPRDPGELLLESQLIPEMEIPALVLAEVERQFTGLLARGAFDVQVVNGPQEDTAWRSIGDYFHLSVPLGQLILAGAQALNRWDLIADRLPMLKDVYYATPTSMNILRAETQYPAECAVLARLDGKTDLLEVINGIDGNRFTYLRAVDQLHHDGHIDTVSPVQLFQLGCEAEQEGDADRALRLLERAEDRGLDDFDIGYKLAELHHRMGDRQKAIDRFLSFAEKCVAQFRIEDTIRACRKVIEIDPDNTAIYERYVSLLARYGRAEEAVSEGLVLARRFLDMNDPERAYATLEKILEHSDANEEVLRFYLETCTLYNNSAGMQRAQRSLANLYYERDDIGRALDAYQQLFVGGDNDVSVRARLVELHYRQGNCGAAADHLAELTQQSGWESHNAQPEARGFFQRLLDFDANDTAASQWLVGDAQARRDRADQLRLLEEHCSRLQRTQQWSGARRACAALFELDREDLAVGRRLAELERRCGNIAQAVEILELVAQGYDARGSHDADLPRIVDQIIELDPMSTIGRDLWRKHGHANSESDRMRMNLEGNLVSLVRGEFENVLPIAQDNAASLALAAVAAELAVLSSDPRALELCVAVGNAAARSNDLGILERTIGQIEKLDPDHADLAAFRQRLAPPAPVAAPAPAPQPQPASLHDLNAASFSQPPQAAEPTSVSGITARLRNMRGDEKPEPVAATAGAAESDAPFTDPSAPPPPKTVDIGGSLSRLKAMKGNGNGNGNPGPQPAATPDVEAVASAEAPPPPPRPTASGVQGSLARLKGMKGGGGGDNGAQPAPANPAAAEAPKAVESKAVAPNSSATQSQVDRDNGANPLPPPKPIKKKLGSAASRLNSLKKKSDD